MTISTLTLYKEYLSASCPASSLFRRKDPGGWCSWSAKSSRHLTSGLSFFGHGSWTGGENGGKWPRLISHEPQPFGVFPRNFYCKVDGMPCSSTLWYLSSHGNKLWHQYMTSLIAKNRIFRILKFIFLIVIFNSIYTGWSKKKYDS
jgi:hypothetical protein